MSALEVFGAIVLGLMFSPLPLIVLFLFLDATVCQWFPRWFARVGLLLHGHTIVTESEAAAEALLKRIVARMELTMDLADGPREKVLSGRRGNTYWFLDKLRWEKAPMLRKGYIRAKGTEVRIATHLRYTPAMFLLAIGIEAPALLGLGVIGLIVRKAPIPAMLLVFGLSALAGWGFLRLYRSECRDCENDTRQLLAHL